jgi:hypothetical protein
MINNDIIVTPLKEIVTPGGNVLHAIKSIDSSFTESDLETITYAQLRAMNNNVSLGSYLNGIIKLVENQDTTINEHVFYHELMHRIYERNLTPLEQAALKTQFGQNMSDIEFKEFVANEFATWVKEKPETNNSILNKLYNAVLRFVKMLFNVSSKYSDLSAASVSTCTIPYSFTFLIRLLKNIQFAKAKKPSRCHPNVFNSKAMINCERILFRISVKCAALKFSVFTK